MSATSGTMASFLINALYLVGNHRILGMGEIDPALAAELARNGHRLDAGEDGTPRGNVAGRYDRVFYLSRALGYGTEAETVAWLRSLRKRLAPGGLVCFQVLDRDRAWSLVGDRSLADAAWDPQGRVDFDPATGRLSARIRKEADPGVRKAADRASGRGTKGRAASVSVRAYNLQEIGALLASTGFDLERAYGDWEGNSPEQGGARTGRLIVVAAKPRGRRRPRFRARSAASLRS